MQKIFIYIYYSIIFMKEFKTIEEKISERIYKIHNVQLDPEEIKRVYDSYLEYVNDCMFNLQDVRIPYLGKFFLKEASYKMMVLRYMLHEQGHSVEYILQESSNQNWRKYTKEIEDYDKVFRSKWREIRDKYSGTFIIPQHKEIVRQRPDER